MISEYSPGRSRLAESAEKTEERPLNTKQSILVDKKALAALLQVIVANTPSRDQNDDLDTNEELLRLIPVLCTNFSRQELVQLVGEKLTARIAELNRLEIAQNLILESELQHILHAFN